MRKTWAIIKNTLLEGLSKFTLIALFGFSTLFILILQFGVNIKVVGMAVSGIKIFGFVLEQQFNITADRLLDILMTIVALVTYNCVLLISVFATADFIPEMLKRGQIDIYLSKPISRPHLLLSKYMGTLLIVMLNIIYIFTAVSLILLLKLKIWNIHIIDAGLLIILMFASVYAFVCFMGIQFNSSAVSIVTVFAMLLFEPILSGILEAGPKVLGQTAHGVLSFFKWVLPNNFSVNKSIFQAINGLAASDGVELFSTLIFGCFFLVLAIARFQKKDY